MKFSMSFSEAESVWREFGLSAVLAYFGKQGGTWTQAIGYLRSCGKSVEIVKKELCGKV